MGLQLGVFTPIPNEEAFEPGLEKVINGLLYTLPICAVIFQHSLVNGQAAVHLKIEHGFSLFIRKEAVLHEIGNKVFF